METAKIGSPAGTLQLWVRDGALAALTFEDRADGARRWLERRFGPLDEQPARDPGGAVTAVLRYLDGDLHALDELRVDTGGTDFQRAVWRRLRRIPPGATTTYGAIAAAIGSPRAVRAVGAANGDNPVAIVIPCHRVIGKDRSLTGYAGGLPRKRWLLEHEGRSVQGCCLAADREHKVLLAPGPRVADAV